MATRTTKPKENKFGAMGASAQAAKAETPTEPVAAKAPAKTRAPRKTPAKAKAPAKPKAAPKAAAAAVEDAKTGGPTPKNRDKKLSTYVTYDTWVALQQRKLEESREGTRTVNDIVNDAIEMYLATKVK